MKFPLYTNLHVTVTGTHYKTIQEFLYFRYSFMTNIKLCIISNFLSKYNHAQPNGVPTSHSCAQLFRYNKKALSKLFKKIASYRKQKPQPNQWVRLERSFVENPCICLSDGEFKILRPKTLKMLP